MDDGRVFACLMVRAPSAAVMRPVLGAICPPLEWPGQMIEEYGSCRALVFVPQTTASASRVPTIARRAADLAYGFGATRVEYFNAAMDQAGKGPRRLRPLVPPLPCDGVAVTVDTGPMTLADPYGHQVLTAHFDDRATADMAAAEAANLMLVDGPSAAGSRWLVAIHLPSADSPDTFFPDPHLLARIKDMIERHGGIVA